MPVKKDKKTCWPLKIWVWTVFSHACEEGQNSYKYTHLPLGSPRDVLGEICFLGLQVSSILVPEGSFPRWPKGAVPAERGGGANWE